MRVISYDEYLKSWPTTFLGAGDLGIDIKGVTAMYNASVWNVFPCIYSKNHFVNDLRFYTELNSTMIV